MPDGHHGAVGLDVARGDLLELIDGAAGLVGNAFAVDQHILGRLAESAVGRVDRVDGEARNLAEHVEGGFGREAGEIGRGEY